MLHYDFEESIGCWLIRASQAYERELNSELAPCGVTLRQTQVIGLLVLQGELTQAELAEQMYIEPPTLVGILDRMERDGWITRHDCPTDRRRKIIRVAPPAEPIWEEMVACAKRIRARATRGMDAERIQQLKKSLALVLENLSGDALSKKTKQ